MSSHESRSQGAYGGRRGRELIAQLFDVSTNYVESLSWPLGNRVTVEADAKQLFELAHRRSTRTVTAFAVTDYTRIVRLRTPIGREKFYGLANVDIVDIPAADEWVHID